MGTSVEPVTVSFILGILIGIWGGVGIVPALLVWIKNPRENAIWKTCYSIWQLLQGPIGLATMKHWLDPEVNTQIRSKK